MLGLRGTAELLASEDVSAMELTEIYLAAIRRIDPALKCYLHVDDAGARKLAAASDQRRRAGAGRGPLDGVPVAVKNNVAVAGWPHTAGLAWRAEQRAAADAAVITRLRAAGAVLLGATNMDEAALGASGNNPHYGACQNPLRLGFSAGGSSGGSACAVRAGLAAWAIGSDTMGSVRIPAAYCGVVGFKPSFAALPTEGVIPLLAAFDHLGFLTRQVADLANLFGALADAAPAVPTAPRRLGVLGLSDRVDLEPTVADAFARAQERAAAAGLELIELPGGDYEPGPTRRAGFLLAERALADWLAEQGRSPHDLSPAAAKLVSFGANQPPAKLQRARERIQVTANQVARWFSRCDALLMPATPQTAFPLDRPVPDSQADFTVLANVTGMPAVSVPAAYSADSLPAAVQLMAPPGEDQMLMMLARCFASERPPEFPVALRQQQ
jgi:Asp-tRNA(Asn)/Glu-tRNA(Gln) amidotransferase A subunit family amidase